MNSHTTISTKKITMLGMFTAMAVVFCLLVRIPLVPSVSFLSYDPKDIIIGIAGFLYGPMSAFIVSMLSSAIELILRGGNIIDWFMNVISTCSFICTAAFVYKKVHSKNGAFYGLMAGMALNILAMIAWNYVMDPIYFGMPQPAVNAMLPAIALFNFLKDAINAVLLLLVYKPVSNALHQAGLIERREEVAPSNKKSAAVLGICILLTAIVVALVFINA
ncbi:MAG: ECF transporter S component [Allobaculum sp.]|nr:ECF transporter S component [Allobaculum sp.]